MGVIALQVVAMKDSDLQLRDQLIRTDKLADGYGQGNGGAKYPQCDTISPDHGYYLQEQTEVIRKRAEKENQLPPTGLDKRTHDFLEWKQKGGWLK